MTSAQSFVLDVVQQSSPIPAPPFFWSVAFPAVHWMRRTWFWMSRAEKYHRAIDDFDITKGMAILGGVALQLGLGNSPFVQLTAKVADVALAIFKVLDDFNQALDIFDELSVVWENEKKNHRIVPADFEPIPLISWSTLAKVHSKKAHFLGRVKKTALLLKELLVVLFKMSLHVLDAITAFEGHLFQVVELGLNVEELSERLYRGDWSKNEALIDRILSKVEPRGGYSFPEMKRQYRATNSPVNSRGPQSASSSSSSSSFRSPTREANLLDIFSSMPAYGLDRLGQWLDKKAPQPGDWEKKIARFRLSERFVDRCAS